MEEKIGVKGLHRNTSSLMLDSEKEQRKVERQQMSSHSYAMERIAKKKKQKYLKYDEKIKPVTSYRFNRTALPKKMEDEIENWAKDTIKKFPYRALTKQDLREKAMEISKSCNIDFKASDGWARSFMGRHPEVYNLVKRSKHRLNFWSP